MTVALTGGTGLFNYIGKQIIVLQNLNTYVGTTLPTNINSLLTLYQTDDLDDLMDGSTYLKDEIKIAAINLSVSLRLICWETVIRMVNDDVGLGCTDIDCGLNEIITQMTENSESVDASTVGSSSSTGASNIGNGELVITTKNANGIALENCFAENILIQCTTSDADDTTTTFTHRGREFIDGLSPEFPGGSGCIGTFTTIIPGNLLENSDFETFTVADIPDNWEIVVGTETTHVAEVATAYTGSSALKLIGDGANLTQLAQTFDNDSYTSNILSPITRYSVCLWVRHDGTPPGDGALVVDLYDDTNSSVMTDDSGTSNTFTIDLTGITNSYVAYSGTFITPRRLPNTYRLRLRLSTAITAGREVYIDNLSIGAMTELYDGGPCVGMHEGSSLFAVNDRFTLTVTNDRAGEFQTWFDRIFNMRALGLQLPSNNAAAETVDDALIA